MTTKEIIYGIPNLGCLLGMAYQTEVARLGTTLNESGLDITPAEYLIIRILLAHGAMQQCEISRILNKDKGSVSRSIQSLVRKGFVNTSLISYKCSMVSLSESGKALKDKILKIAGILQEELSEKLTLQQMDNLREILEKIIR